MNELTLMDNNGIEVVDSRQIAEAVGKEHSKLLRDIRTYCDYLNQANFGLVDFFIESTYTDSKGEKRSCYFCTRKGCEMIANKLTGKKGVVFTALYVNAFHEMKQQIAENTPAPKVDTYNEKALEIEEMKVRVQMSDQLLKIADISTLSAEYKNILISKSVEILTGEMLLPLPKSEQKTYSAGEIGKMFGVSPQKIGRVANLNSLKSEEYGCWYRDKSPYSHKEIDTFRYNEKAVEKFREIFSHQTEKEKKGLSD